MAYAKTRLNHWYQARPQSHEREFLPAALEILDTPASPAGRGLAYLVMVFFTLALLWSYIGQVDVNAVAPGQLVPLDGVKAIQPFEAGIVRKIHVANGQHVTAGQTLIELDSTENQVDLSQLQRQQELAQQDIVRLKATLDGIDGRAPPSAPGASGQALHQQNRQNEQIGAYRARLSALQAQQAESHAAIAASELEQDKLSARLPVLEEKANAWKRLSDQKMASRIQWLELENERVLSQKSLSVEKQKTAQARATLARVNAELGQARSDSRRQTLTELVEAEDKAKEAELSIRRYREREQYRTLRAPVSGHIQQLVIHTIGGVVQPAQQLLVIAPDNATLVVDAKVLNQDIGFVRSGLPVTLKVESYPYSKYGILSGTVDHVSHDAVPDEKLGPVFAARIKLPIHPQTQTGVRLPLQAGMAVTAEIKTDSRRVIDYLLSPIKEVFSEAIRER
ncbi:HlyD family type I secretion periplasmic adaptor subunit [Chromobacterium piscinae]|uniref:Membrane fusion protein (MFP) family protein n=2 Tax=Betaproteobacteria TaxID=28216 RepID=A0ABV0HA55_9NEIS